MPQIVSENLLMLGIFGLPGGGEWIILLILGLLIFGRRLPEVGRSIGKSIVEFKRGIKDIEDDVDEESTKPKKLRESDKRLPDERTSSKLSESASERSEQPENVASTSRDD